MCFTIRLADKIISVTSMHKYIYDYCRDYISEDKSDFAVKIAYSQE